MKISYPFSKTIVSDNVDGLVVAGIRYIKENNEKIWTRTGTCIQSYGVNYILLNSRNRLLTLRHPTAIRYLCREFLAYFKGSLKVRDGLSRASKHWLTLANEKGMINSNYGFYIFYQRVRGRTQYEWIIRSLERNPNTRRAMFNINQPSHKMLNNKDFPCAVSAQFFVNENNLCCDVFSRSVDVVWGLPYDIGFFSFLNELVCANLNGSGKYQLELGYTAMRCSFTQIYSKTADRAEQVLINSERNNKPNILMPAIADAELTLQDIYKGSQKTEIMRWIHENAEM